ncbi:hypothetical protein HNR46_003188 [Haloferula luteola]|uniref:Uncharacterized protein n=2 Tax=Haloferula luteola TaxID=595692 RepID=A0A840VGJ0_9BACT|nr:hypothetical protein [Haloferula luteola]
MNNVAKVDWDRFEDLPGATTSNFEALCRALIRLHGGRFGIFRATAQMPGIEFHLKLLSDCTIGKAGDWYGWQCRWYGTGRGVALGKARRNKIVEAIRTSEKYFPQLTDWVLWTRHPLTAGDDKWFHKIQTKFRLHSRDTSYAEDLLSGDALILRSTYFGEWVLRPDSLVEGHKRSVSSIHSRWLHETHQEVEAERRLLRILGEADSWKKLLEVADELAVSVNAIRSDSHLPSKFKTEIQNFIDLLQKLVEDLRSCPKTLADGDFDLLQQILEQRQGKVSPQLRALPRHLRSLRLPINFHAANGLVNYDWANRLLDEMQACLGTRIQAVMADAGGGKTQLAAEITAPRGKKPAGILLHGRDLKSGEDLNDLAHSFILDGKPMPSFEALIAALDAAANRARCRLPLVIDGLNEAEDPRDWKKALSEADITLRKYPAVLLVVTLRTGSWRPSDEGRGLHGVPIDENDVRTIFARIALPEGTPLIEMNGFDENTREAIERYLKYFRIKARLAELPIDLLNHPLTLRIFCEVTNPSPQKGDVGPEALPRSLIQLFERYVARSVERIGELSPKAMPFSGQDVRRALNQLALLLWNKNSREVDQDEYRTLINDSGRLWSHSLVKLMEQEGLILRVARSTDGKYGVIPVYDAIGGYLIANAIVAERGYTDFIAWIQNERTILRFASETWTELHPMAGDIFRALVALTPRRFQQEQLWGLIPEKLKLSALLEAIELEGDLIDQATIAEVSQLIHQSKESKKIFGLLLRSRAIPKHPFNATFIDAQFRLMTNSERDLSWTEIVRRDYEQQYRGLARIGEEWELDRSPRSESDILLARWRMWLLTTTSHEMRMKVTRALYWFGRHDPSPQFALTIESLSISDPYVPERMLAACYGIVMNLHGANRNAEYEVTVLKEFARALYENLFAPHAPYATTHALTREYARRIIEVASVSNRSLLTSEEAIRVVPPYPSDLHAEMPEIEVKREFDQVSHPSPFRMDFENYTLGRLVPGRGNYNYTNEEYRRVVAQVLGRVQDLGWTSELFEEIDHDISSSGFYSRRDENSHRKVDRYGKKYSLIAYYELAGMREDLGLLKSGYWNDSDRSFYVDIDPSFLERRCAERLSSKNWLAGNNKTLASWVARGPMPDTTDLLRRNEINGEKASWFMLDGYFTQQDKVTGRDIFFFVRSLLVSEKKHLAIAEALKRQSMKVRWLPEKPGERYAYAGEFPWCSTFSEYGLEQLRFVTESETVTVTRKQADFDGIPKELLDQAFDLLSSHKPLPKELKESLEAAHVSRNVSTQEVREKFVSYNATIPVVDFLWEGPAIDDESGSGVFLSKRIAKKLDLRWIAGTHDLADATGQRATYNTEYGFNTREDRQTAFFLREDLLRKYLRQTRQTMIWITWGERGIANHLYQSLDRNSFGEPFKVFQEIEIFDPKLP